MQQSSKMDTTPVVSTQTSAAAPKDAQLAEGTSEETGRAKHPSHDLQTGHQSFPG